MILHQSCVMQLNHQKNIEAFNVAFEATAKIINTQHFTPYDKLEFNVYLSIKKIEKKKSIDNISRFQFIDI